MRKPTTEMTFVELVALTLEGWGHLPTGGDRAQDAMLAANAGYIADAERLGMDHLQCAKNISTRTRY